MIRTLLPLIIALAGMFSAQASAAEQGYWKYHVPPESKPFGNDDVVALARGQHLVTDCSIPWIGGDGNTYCFHDIAAREEFLHAPVDFVRQAQRFMQNQAHPGSQQTQPAEQPTNTTSQ